MHLLLRLKPNQTKALWNRKGFAQKSFSYIFSSLLYFPKEVWWLCRAVDRAPKAVTLNPRLRWLILLFFLKLEGTWTVSLKPLQDPRKSNISACWFRISVWLEDRHSLPGTSSHELSLFIFLWTLLDCFMVMDLSFELFWVWTKTTSVATEPRTELGACVLCSPGCRARGQECWMTDLAYWKHSGLVAITLQQYLKALIAVGYIEAPKKTVFALKSLPVSIWQDAMNK